MLNYYRPTQNHTYTKKSFSVSFCRLPAAVSPVTTVSVEYNCNTASATVLWGATFGAESYHVTAVSQSGPALSCSSTGTSCVLTNVSCGAAYTVSVSTIANNCESTGNATASFQTGERHSAQLLVPMHSQWVSPSPPSDALQSVPHNKQHMDSVLLIYCRPYASIKDQCSTPCLWLNKVIHAQSLSHSDALRSAQDNKRYFTQHIDRVGRYSTPCLLPKKGNKQCSA